MVSNFFSLLFGRLVVASFMVFQTSAEAAVELQRVVITGAATNSSAGGFGGAATNKGLSNKKSTADPVETAASREEVKASCFSGAEDVTSMFEPEIRYGIANNIHKQLNAAGLQQQKGKIMTVIWADGGSTGYLVMSNGPTAYLSQDPDKTSEKTGDGIKKDQGSCGKA